MGTLTSHYVMVVSLIVALARIALAEDTGIAEIERRALAARARLVDGHVRIVCVERSPGLDEPGSPRIPATRTEIVYDMSFRHDKLRVDSGWSKYVLTEDSAIDYTMQPPGVSIRPPEERGPGVFNPRLFGLRTAPVGRLHATPIDGMVGSPARKSTTVARETMDNTVRVEYLRENGNRVRMWFDPERDFNLVRAESHSQMLRKPLLDAIECRLEQFISGEEEVWFPKTVSYRRVHDGRLLYTEVATVADAAFNYGLPDSIFTFSGLNHRARLCDTHAAADVST